MAQLIKYPRYVSEITTEMIEDERLMTIHSEEYGKEESEKCKASPYYFYTTYYWVNGKPATTMLSEEEFNNQFFQSIKTNPQQ